MFNHDTGTPCPQPFATTRGYTSQAVGESKQKQRNIFEDALDDFNDNTTQNIAHFVQQEFKNAQPRKIHGLSQKPKRNGPIRIFNDGGSNRESCRREEATRPMKGSVINSRPAQKIRMQSTRKAHSFAPSTSSNHVPQSKVENDSYNSFTNTEDTENTKDRKDDRRRTIWIPSDNTTIMSIHPGAYTHTLSDETIGFPSTTMEKAKNTSRKGLGERSCNTGATIVSNAARKAASVAPKRGALSALAPPQPNAPSHDVLGSGGGKENIPPGTLFSRYNKSEKPVAKPLGDKKSQLQQTSLLMQPTVATHAKTANVKKRSASEIKDAPKAKVPVIKDPRPKAHAPRIGTNKPSINDTVHVHPNHRAPSKLIMPVIAPCVSGHASLYPVLSDDLCQPELYEDNWLQHQEVAMTELVNGVLRQANQPSAAHDDHSISLRGKLLNLYHTQTVATLHKRLGASLMYGALSMPRDSPNAPKIREDVGLRRQFLDLFVESYELSVLQAAVEAVVGRAMALYPRPSNATQSENSDAMALFRIKELRRFLLTFLVHHEDSTELLSIHKLKPSQDPGLQPGTAEWFWQRTVLRGLMLIHLLDQAKTTGSIAGCLFQTSSAHKSSASVLQGFARLMIPSVGDVTRPLGHLDYVVCQTQEPLEEYEYRIDNLAIDLRNGVLLTRFVEILLYPSSILKTRDGCTVTVAFPDGETLTSILDDSLSSSAVLTQHLKFPCVGRIQKLYNVQIALSALIGVRGLTETAMENIKAEDIVDGHREKTLSLLWSLVSRWGLGLLIDWEELHQETRRFSGPSASSFDFETGATGSMSSTQPDSNEQATLLKYWAASVCQQHNVAVTNLTTSFADGRALSAIIAAYADFMPVASQRSQSSSRSRSHTSKAEKLRSLGCSEAFVDLFASQATTIPSRSSTVSLLAFLASRLLPLARTHRAACTVQRAYRLRLARRDISIRIQKMSAASECAFVAQTKQKELEATIILQRAWRSVLDRRINNLERDVLAFQTLVRGWAVRDALRVALGGGNIGGRRVRGGW